MIQFIHLQQALAQYGDAIADRYKTNLEASGRRATGNLITSVNTTLTVNELSFTIELQLEDYYKYVEEGRSAGRFPPVSKILEWIKVKPILPTPDRNGKLPTENQLAFLIGRKIANEGFQGTYDLEHTMEEVDYSTIIEEAMDKDVLDCFEELLLILG